MPGRHRLVQPHRVDRRAPALYAPATAAETAVVALAVLGAIALLVGTAVTTVGPLGAALVVLGAAAGAAPSVPRLNARRSPR